MKNSKLNIVVISWNALDYLKFTIEGIFKTVKTPYILTIIDNSSTKNTTDYIHSLQTKGQCQKIISILNTSNLGYCKAVNQGLAISIKENCSLTCFCNNDLYFSDGWIKNLIGELSSDSSLTAVYPLGISSYTTYQGISTRVTFDKISRQNLSPSEEIYAYFGDNPSTKINEIKNQNSSVVFDRFPQFAPDHCVLVKTNDIENIGFWADEQYGLYGSNDVDICWEIFKKHKKIKISNKAFVYHFRHKSIFTNNLDRKTHLIESSKLLLDKWKKEFDNIQKQRDFFNNFFNLNNRDYSILRLINEKTNFIDQSSKVLAVFGCLGKTYFYKKYPKLSEDIEVGPYRHKYDSNISDELQKGLPGRSKNTDYPNNYIKAIGKKFNKKSLLFIVLSEEILSILDRMGIMYDIVYPRKNMRTQILERIIDRGNSKHFYKKIDRILTEYDELNRLTQNTNPQKIHFANKDDTLESIVKRDIIIDLKLNKSRFTYKGVSYDVIFDIDIEKYNLDSINFSQVYCIGNINGQVPIVTYNKKGRDQYNLPGGTRENGETIEQTLRREIEEEINCNIIDYKIIGIQQNISHIDKNPPFQIRVYAELERKGKFKGDVGGSVTGYKLTNIDDLEKTINWGEVGDILTLILKENYEK